MKKFLKIGAAILLILFVFILSVPFLFKGKIIRTIQEEANKNLKAKLSFSEDVKIGLLGSFPRLTVELKDLCLSGTDTFRNDTLAMLPSVAVSVDVMSVIRGERIEIRKVFLESPKIRLLVLENGMANWDIAIEDSTAADTTPSAFRMALDLLEIRNGYLDYDDRSLPFRTTLNRFNHKLRGDFTLDRFVMETETDAEELILGYGGVDYIYKAAADIKANLDMDMKEMKFAFRDNHIKLNELELGGEGFVDMNDKDMEFDLAFRSKKTDFRTIMSMVPGIYKKGFEKAKASGKLDFSGYLKGRMTEDKMPGFGLNLNIDNGYFQYPDLPKSLNNIFVNLKVDNKTGYPDHTVVDLSRFNAVIAGEPVFAKLLMKTPISDPYTEGAVKGKINLSEFRNFIPLDKSTEISGLISSDIAFKGHVSTLEGKHPEKFDASGTLAADRFHFKDAELLPQGTDLDASMRFNPMNVDLDKCVGKVGMSDFDAKGHLENIFGYMLNDGMLKGNFTLNSNYFNANEFLSDGEVKKEPSPSDSLPLQAFDVPGNIDFTFGSRISTLIYDNLKLTDLKGNILLKDKQLHFDDLGVNLLQGSMSLNGIYDSRNPKFPFSNVNFVVRSIDIIESFGAFDLIRKFAPVAGYTHGHFNADIRMTNHFNPDLSVAYPTVSGDIKLALTEAMLKNMPALNVLADKLKIDKLRNLSLKKQSLRLSISNGRMILDSMILPLWTGAKAKISGYTALDQSIRYVAKLSIPRKDFGEANAALNNLTDQAVKKGIPVKISEMVDIDVLIGGFFSKPDVKVSLHDAKSSLIGSVRDQLQEEAEKRKQAAIDEARRRAELAKKKTTDSLNRIRQQAIDKAAAERKALEEKAAEEKRKAEEKAREEAERAKKEAEKKLEEEKKKALDKLKGGLLRK